MTNSFGIKTVVQAGVVMVAFVVPYAFATPMGYFEAELTPHTWEGKAMIETGNGQVLSLYISQAQVGYNVDFQFNAANAKPLDFLANLKFFLREDLGPNHPSSAGGKILMERALVNGEVLPRLELFCLLAEHEDKERQLKFVGNWGTALISATLSRRGPATEVKFYVQRFPVARLLALFYRNANEFLSGEASGWVMLRIEPSRPLYMEADLEIFEGRLQDLVFQRATVSFKGQWPRVRFGDNSYIYTSDQGCYGLKGSVDLSVLDNLKSPLHEMNVLTLGNSAPWQEWVILRDQDRDENSLSLVKQVGKDFSVKMEASTSAARENAFSEEEAWELRYHLRGNEYLQLRVDQEEGTLGWQKRWRF